MKIAITKELFLPEEYRGHFEVEGMEKEGKKYVLIVVEREGLIPKELIGKEAVMNGYCDVVELIDYPFHGEMMYLKFYRRRWKGKGGKESFSNTYNLHVKGCKLTIGFGNFLKGLTGYERDQLCKSVTGLQDVWEANKHLV